MTFDLTRWAVAWRGGGRQTPEPPVPSGEPIIGRSDRGFPITWPTPSPERAGHLVCLAGSGAGKTMLIANGLVHEVVAGFGRLDGPRDQVQRHPEQPLAVLVVDPKGDLTTAVIEGLAFVAPHRLEAVRYLDPFSDGAFSFNLNKLNLGATPLDIRAMQLAGLVSEVSTATGAQKHLGVGARQLDVLGHVLLGALACDHPRATPLWALDALLIPKGLQTLAALTSSIRAKQFLLTANLSDELRVSCASRLRTALAATDGLERIASSSECIQFAELMAPGRICLVDLGRPVGGLAALQQFWANLVGRLAIEFLMERSSPWTGHHCRVIVDEAQVVAPVLADRAEAILTTGRSRGLSLTVITQGTTLLHEASPTLIRILFGNAPLKFIGRLGAPDAELLAREQAPGRGVDETLGAVRGRFTAAVTNLPDRTFLRLLPGRRERFTSAPVDVAAWKQAAAEHADLIEAVKRRLALPLPPAPRLSLSALQPPPPRRRGRRRGRGAREAPLAAPSLPEATGGAAWVPAQSIPAAPVPSAGPSPERSPTVPPRSRWG